MSFFKSAMFQRHAATGAAAGTAAPGSTRAEVGVAYVSRHPHSDEWAMVMLFGTIAALYFAREILIPLAFALILTFVLSPLVSFLQKFRIGRPASVALAVLTMAVVIGFVGWIIAFQLVDVAQDFPRYRQNIHAKMEALRIPTQGPIGLAARSLREIAAELAWPESPVLPAPAPPKARGQRASQGTTSAPVSVQVVEAPPNALEYFKDLVQPVFRPIGIASLVLLFTVFMLIKRFDLRYRLLRLVGLGQINLVTQALDDAAVRVSRYLLMQMLVNIGFGVVFGAGLYFIGVPNPALWGVLAGLMRIVPYVGTLAAASLPILLSLAAFNTWLPPLLVFLLFAGLELVIANFFEPWLYGTRVGISALALLVAAIFWSLLWGPAGLILSTPLTVCLVVIGRYVPQLAFLNVLLGDDEALGAEAQIYQHLLAMDQAEARCVVDRFLKDRTLLALYDSVLVPALSLAEQDRHKGAIDIRREEFLFLSINEMITELSDWHLATDEPLAGAAVVEPASTQHFNTGILCVPANDQADEVTAAMLAQLLEQTGYTALSLPLSRTSPDDLLAYIEKRQADVVCISALPPYALSPARTICKLIRDRFPTLKLVVGVWGFSGDAEKAKARFGREQPNLLLTSMAQAVEQFPALICPGILGAPAPGPPAT